MLFISFLVLGLISASEAATCTLVSGSTCKCTLSDGATGTVDLSPLFGSPLEVTAGGEKYVVDACNAVASTCKNCGSGTADPCAGCQDARGMGGFPPTITVLSTSPLTLNFTYSNGYDGRTFNVVFKYDPNGDGKLMFTKEEPPLHYQFEVDSPFSPSGNVAFCLPVPGSYCKCSLATEAGILKGTIDLLPMFPKPLQVTALGETYVVDACNAVTGYCGNCTSGPCAGCDGTRGMGGFPPSIKLLSASPLNLDFSYSNGYGGRSFDVQFKYDPNGDGNLKYIKEDPSLHYKFEVYSPIVNPNETSCILTFGSYCKCFFGNGKYVDVSYLFTSGPLQVQIPDNEWFLYDACKVVPSCKCANDKSDCAGCQNSNGFRGMGAFPPSITTKSLNPLVISFAYIKGNGGRTFVVDFIQNSEGDNRLVYNGTDPTSLDYHFQIESPLIYPNVSACKLIYGSYCKCILDGKYSVDLSPIFTNGPLKVSNQQGGEYIYDACSVVPTCTCKDGSLNCAGCQGSSYGMGEFPPNIAVEAENPLILKLTYLGGSGGQQFDVTFKSDPHGDGHLQFDNKGNFNYHFKVDSPCVTPGVCTGQEDGYKMHN